jgi:hypothetical protein
MQQRVFTCIIVCEPNAVSLFKHTAHWQRNWTATREAHWIFRTARPNFSVFQIISSQLSNIFKIVCSEYKLSSHYNSWSNFCFLFCCRSFSHINYEQLYEIVAYVTFRILQMYFLTLTLYITHPPSCLLPALSTSLAGLVQKEVWRLIMTEWTNIGMVCSSLTSNMYSYFRLKMK